MAAVSVAMRGRALARPFEPCARPPSTATSFPREPALSLLRPVNSNAPRRSFAAHVATNDINTEYEVNTDQGDYYSILGLTPAATPKEIKASYRKVMKDYHPDLSNDADANDFAIFLNQVYETLMDPDSRAEYDAISGFAIAGINPFMDATYAAEYAFVDEFSCIGCRNCNNVCPKTFEMEEEHGRARVMRQDADTPEKVQEAIDTCPVSCIHWVTAPQLTMLEETMGKMERVDTWVLMNGGGKGANLNVFFEASIAWEKRQSERRAQQQKARWAWAPFTPASGANMQEAARQAADASADDDAPRVGKRVNAAAMANAARRWRDFQRKKRQRDQKLLSDAVSN